MHSTLVLLSLLQYAGHLAGINPEDGLQQAQALSLALSVEELAQVVLQFLWEKDEEVKVCCLSLSVGRASSVEVMFAGCLSSYLWHDCFLQNTKKAKFMALEATTYKVWVSQLGEGPFMLGDKVGQLCLSPPLFVAFFSVFFSLSIALPL